MSGAPIDTYQSDLTKLLVEHPALWRFDDDARNPSVLDATGAEVDVGLIFTEEDDVVAAGIVAAVNLAAGLRP